jgi:Fe-S cluster assembly protein SufD
MVSSTLEMEQSLQNFSGAAPSGDAPEWLRRFRSEAAAVFASTGLPTTELEAWRFTNVAPLARTTFVRAPEGVECDPALLRGVDVAGAVRIVFVNGRFEPRCSRLTAVEGLTVEPLSAGRGPEGRIGRVAPLVDHPFVALNGALFDDGAAISVADGADVRTPVHLVFVTTTARDGSVPMTNPRVVISAGTNSRLTLVESYSGDDGAAYFTNSVAEIELADGASLDHYRLQHESAAAYHIAALFVRQNRDSSYRSHSFQTGGALARTEISVALDGEGANAFLDGLYLTDGTRHVDNQTRVDHLKPHTTSTELYKGILDDRSRGVFDGRVIVHKDAQKTSAAQSNRNLILSRDAVIDTKPQLEIFADDVKCTHGSTVGQIDDNALFYLRSRGIPLAQARNIMTYAFASEIVERCSLEEVRSQLQGLLLRRLPGGRLEGGNDGDAE